jgi:hypothetical protein
MYYLDPEQQADQDAAKKKLDKLVDRYTDGEIKAHRFLEKAITLMLFGHMLSGWSEHDAAIELNESYKGMNNILSEAKRKVYWGE